VFTPETELTVATSVLSLYCSFYSRPSVLDRTGDREGKSVPDAFASSSQNLRRCKTCFDCHALDEDGFIGIGQFIHRLGIIP
jgi:hypothetical protein